MIYSVGLSLTALCGMQHKYGKDNYEIRIKLTDKRDVILSPNPGKYFQLFHGVNLTVSRITRKLRNKLLAV